MNVLALKFLHANFAAAHQLITHDHVANPFSYIKFIPLNFFTLCIHVHLPLYEYLPQFVTCVLSVQGINLTHSGARVRLFNPLNTELNPICQ